MAKPNKKTLKFLQTFGNDVSQNPELLQLVSELSKIPDAGADYETAMNNIFDFLDKLLKEETLNNNKK